MISTDKDMKLRVYLDTSVFSAYYDHQEGERQILTLDFWSRFPEFEVATSEIAKEEMSKTQDLNKRKKLLDLLTNFKIYPITPEMEALADRYIKDGVFTISMDLDALHVAAAVITRHDILVSWNFKHLVNRRRRARVNDINTAIGIPTIDIVAPPEI